MHASADVTFDLILRFFCNHVLIYALYINAGLIFWFISTCSMQYYMEKTYYKTASLISNSCKAIALLAGQTAEVATLAHEYGKNLVSVSFGSIAIPDSLPRKTDVYMPGN